MPGVPATVHLSLLADGPADSRDSRIHSVVVWTDRGDSYCQTLPVPVSVAVAAQATGGLLGRHPSAAGLTWCIWALDSVPGDLRHLPPGDIVRVLAGRLTGQANDV